ncbi:MAG TPA: UDP-N-acetylglucosamine 2-epimerase (non-hydrolyzing), partial [Planctomycetota bacterium]|nr:UDP-N-acetylglucosamine 2-epimerase (non-hydrolyzing) [Planctomycetota bacterium]
DSFFADLEIPDPWRNLGVGSGTHATQTAEIMQRFEPALDEAKPDVLCVVGDVNSTIACALVAVKKGVPTAHVEAGLRSFDRTMPEEINRVLTDAISDTLYVTERSGMENLAREGVDPSRCFLTGNVMIDTLLRFREKARGSDVTARLGVEPRKYGVLTLHRPSNVDDPATLLPLIDALSTVAAECPLVFPAHPRTRRRLEDAGVDLARRPGFVVCEPLRYLDFLALMDRAKVLLTDSGGVQEEACVVGVPCLTLRENTEPPATAEAGVNRLVGSHPARVRDEALKAVRAAPAPTRTPDLWDGRASERIAAILLERYGRGMGGGKRA